MRKYLLFIVGLMLSKASFSQSISGTTCVTTGTSYRYSYSGTWNGSTTMNWTLSGGVITSTGLTYESGTPLQSIYVTWNSGITTGTVGVSTTTPSAGPVYLTVTASSTLVGGTISPTTQTISYSATPGTISCTVATGGNCAPSYSYQWQSAPDNITWTAISGATSQNLSFSAGLTTTTYYRRQVYESVSNTYAYSASSVVNVNPAPIVVGSASPTYQMSNTYTETPENLISTPASLATCGDGSCLTYQWQSSTDHVTWTNITGENTLFYNPGATLPSTTTYYRMQVSATGATTVYSTVDTIGQQTSTIEGPTNCWVGETVIFYYPYTEISYSWNPPVGCTIISGATTNSLTIQWTQKGVQTIYFTYTDGTGPHNLQIIVNVQQLALNPGYIGIPTTSVEQYSSNPVYCTPAFGGSCGGSYSYQWMQSTDDVTFTAVSGQTSGNGTFSPSQTTYYCRKVTCSTTTLYSDTTEFITWPYFHPGTITAGNTDSIAWNTTPLPITGGNPSGGDDTLYLYQWQYSIDGVNFNLAPNTFDGISYQPGNLATTTWYRRAVTNGSTTRYTDTVEIKVKIVLFYTGVLTPSMLVTNTTTSVSLSGDAATGGTSATYSYQWQQSYDEITWTNSSGATSANYSPGTLSRTTYYRRLVTNGVQSGYATVSSIMNDIKVKIVPGLGAAITPTTATQGTSSATNIPINPYTLSGLTAAKINSVTSINVDKPVTTVAAAEALTSVTDAQQVTRYFDDLGRLVQTVAKQGTPDQKDLISVENYDILGREVQQYLPYTDSSTTGTLKTNAPTEQKYFYNSMYSNLEGFYYTNTQYENSPTNRVLKVTEPGNSWTGSNVGIRTDYTFNTSSDSVVVWVIGSATTAYPTKTGYYSPGTLALIITTDEQENKIAEYKDMAGRTILKKVQLNDTLKVGYNGWLCTYYVYDSINRLRYVLSPDATNYAATNSWSLSSTSVQNGYCFQYNYDGEGKMTIKRVPGAGPIYMVYDARKRLVMTQDSLLHSQNNWEYTNYDSLDRPVLTGIWNNSNNQSYMQTQAGGSVTYPSPTSNYTVLTQTYYDDYSWISGSGSGLSSSFITTNTTNTAYFYTASNSAAPYPQAIAQNNIVMGALTGTKTNVLNTSTYLYAVTFYDDHSRVVQMQNTNYTGGTDTVTTQYSFGGVALRTLDCHAKGGTNPQQYRIATQNKYGPTWLLDSIVKKTGNSPTVVISQTQYDELSRVLKKSLGQKRNSLTDTTYSSSPIDSLRYGYNIRGWINGINKTYADAGSATNWFGMELDYDFGFTSTLYNGNIAGIKWRNADDGQQRAYGFTYDNTNRLVKADFTQNAGGTAWNTAAGVDFSIHGITYDLNGNITTLNQMGVVVNTSLLIDSLVYGYNSYSNQLNYVTDKVNDTAYYLRDFTEINNNTSQDYTYDGNGSLTEDNNKNISLIHYNYLSLPDSIRITHKGIIKYVYDAKGTLLQKLTTDSTVTPVKSTRFDYVGAFLYQNDTLQYITHEEGRVRPEVVDKTDTMWYDYTEKDHLGNTRVVLTDQTEQDVYPAATLENNSQAFALEQEYYFIKPADTIHVSSIASWGVTSGRPYYNNNGDPPYNNNPYENTTDTSAIVYKLNGATGDTTGLGITLKVMAGDVVNIYAKSFWHSNGVNPTNTYLIKNAINSFLGAMAVTPNIANNIHNATTDLENAGSPTPGDAITWLDSVPNPTLASVPRAYINWILFDDQFKVITSGSGFDLINTTSDAIKNHNISVAIAHGGYLYVYCSNESNINVYFDNLQVIQTRGPLLETDNYYPFGLTQAGISSQAAGKIENKFKFGGKEIQHKEFSDGSGLEWTDYGARMYDGQIGRWDVIDPISEKMTGFSPYCYVFDNPTRFTDPDGKDPKDQVSDEEAIHRLDRVATLPKSFDIAYRNSVSKEAHKNGEEWAFTVGVTKDNIYVGSDMHTDHDGTSVTPHDDVPDGQTYVGVVHTHLSKLNNPELKDIPPSAGDVSMLRDHESEAGTFDMIESNTKRFAVVITDAKKATSFFASNDLDKMKSIYDMVFHDLSVPGTRQEVAVKALELLLKGSGITFYATDDAKKQNFKKVF